MYTVISTAGDRTGDHRLQSRNTTTEPLSKSHISDAKLASYAINNVVFFTFFFFLINKLCLMSAIDHM